MIYTVDSKTFKKRIENNPETVEDFGPMKVLGRKTDAVGDLTYKGRYVWKTKEDAKKYTTDAFAVFGVDASWNEDTVEAEGEDYRRLDSDAKLISL